MVEAPSKDKIIGYLGVGAGVALGYMMSGMFLKLSTRIGSALKSVFSKSQRANAPQTSTEWMSWASQLLAILIWGCVAVLGYTRFRRDEGALNGVLLGIGIGGVAEELLYNFGGGA